MERTDSSAVTGVEGQVLGGRFVLEHCLKSRPASETWRATDSTDGSPVVVKLIDAQEVSSAVRLRLEHEARVLGRVDLPAHPIASGADGRLMYLVQAYVDGHDLQRRLAAGPLSIESTLRLGVDVFGALSQVHELGIVHRDVKPANIIVSGDDPVERAVLIDFGLARSGWLEPELRDEPVGTARYLAPEVAGVVDTGIDERADLYAAGVVLYECISGRPPFAGSTVGEVLRAHATEQPVPLRSVSHGVPGALDEMVQRLLAKDPSERYQSAAAVVVDLEALIASLRTGVADPPVAIGLADRRRSLTDAGYVGRAAERNALSTVIGGPDRRPGLVLLEAESGGGKSRMLEEVTLRLDPSIRVLRGQGVDRVALRPFQILDGVVAGLARVCDDDPEFLRALRARLAGWTDAIVSAVPALAAMLGVDASAEAPEAYGEARTISALCAVLDAVGAVGGPVLVVLDDAQWADALTLKLLAEWPLPGRLAVDSQLVIVAAFRSEDVDEQHPLRSAPNLAHLRLTPMTDDEIVALCESMAGRLPPEAAAAVIRLAEGSPFMAAAVLRGLVEAGVLEHSGDGWGLDEAALGQAQTSRRAALFLTRRLDRLSEPAHRLLSAGAVLGKVFSLDAALELTDLEPIAAAAALDESRRGRVVWVNEREGTCSFAHDKLRENLLEQLLPDIRRSLHRRAADRLKGVEPAPAFELAYHFDAAGLPERAFPFAMEAGRLARRRYALDVAVAQFRIAERGRLEGDPAAQLELHESLGEVLSLAGEYSGAEDHLKQALELTTDTTRRSALEGKLGDVAFRRGDQVAARGYVEGALRQLGRWVPRSGIGYLVGALWEILVQVGHTAFPRRLGRRSMEEAHTDFLAARLYSRLAYVYWFSCGRVPCAWSHLRELNLVERYPPSPELAQAWSEHAPVMTMIPWFKRGIAYAKKSYDVRVALGDEWGQGQSLSFHGVVLYAASRYEECIDSCRQAVDLLSRMGDRWEENTAGWHIALSHYRLGQLGEAVDVARRVHARAAAIGDRSSRGISLSAWSRASGGNVPADLVAAELALGTDDAHTSVEVRVAETVRLISDGEWRRACVRVDEALAIMKGSGLRQEYVAPAYSWSATARRGYAASLPAVAGREREEALRQARSAARLSLVQARSFRNNLPHAFRESAMVAAMSGRRRKAERLLRRSLQVAEAQHADNELALSRAVEAELLGVARPSEHTDADRGVQPGPRAYLSADESHDWTFSLADRFSTVLEVSHEITAAPSPEAVYQAVREASARLLRADRCHIVELSDEEDLEEVEITESGHPLDEISRGLIRRAVESGRPVVAGESLADDSSESMVLSNARSSLCAPIFCDGRAVAVIYVISRHLAGLFGEQEAQLASFVTTLAGAALEHVAGSEARFRSLVQNSSDVITIVDEDGRITYQSASLTKVFGIEPESLVGSLLSEWVHPDDFEELLSHTLPDDRRLETSSPVKCRLSDSTGAWRQVETAVTDLRADPGVRGIVLNTRDVSERFALEEELRHRAWHDIVTGLANRALFTERVNHARARNARHSGPFSVLFLDLDDFKSINDTLGHATGDQVLRVVATRLSDCVREEDTVARFGGDEFAILLEGADGERARQVCERVLAALAESIDVRGHEVEAQASIGMVLNDAADSGEGLLAAADAALYVAKARGKRRFEAFEPSMRAAAVARAGLRNELDHALERSELRLVYQPVVTLSTGEVAGFEALLRWARPHGVVLNPDQFISLAEESGAIVPIGAWVLNAACRQAQEWRALTGRPITMAVNLSARQLLHVSLIDEVRSALASSGLDPSALILEITESVTVQETEAVMSKLHELKALGVGLAIDDFGTGYSALSYLRRLPVDVLKVDRSFVSGLGFNAEDVAIVQTVISLARALGLETIAEGVESLGQLEILSRLGCDHAQGYNWKKPSSPDEISTWILEGGTGSLAVRPSVLVVDDSASIRATLRVAFDIDGRFNVIGEAADSSEALSYAGSLQPDFVLLDIQIPGRDGQDLLPDLLHLSPHSNVVILTAMDASTVSTVTRQRSGAVLDKTRDFASVIDRLADLIPVSKAG